MEDHTMISTFQGLNLRLKSLVRRFLHDTDAAEDVIQEAFCRLWPRRGSIETSSDAQALATTVVRNICIDRVRHEGRFVECAIDEDRDSACSASAQENMEVSEQYEWVSRYVNERLSTMQREVLRLHDFEGFSFEEIAEKLNIEQTAVRMNLSRARRAIRDQYNEWNR